MDPKFESIWPLNPKSQTAPSFAFTKVAPLLHRVRVSANFQHTQRVSSLVHLSVQSNKERARERERHAMDMQSDFDRLLFFEHARKTAEAAYAKDPLDADVRSYSFLWSVPVFFAFYFSFISWLCLVSEKFWENSKNVFFFKLFLGLVGAEFNEVGRCSSGVVSVSNCSRFKEDDIRCLYKFIFNIF